ncbi:MAG: hypothetical protein MK085_12135, partial [Phycisphaerales bacterium]|nr:hypothetical protein [Phycisphaerales bacterium]
MELGTTMNQIRNDLDIMSRPGDLVEHLATLPALAGVVLVAVGAACVINGYRWHRWIMVVLALLLGYGIGQMLSQELGKSSVIAIALGVLLAAIATPMLRFTVAFFAGLAGAAIGATLWAFFKTDQPELAWAGAGMGFIALALLSFIFFRIVVIVFTSVGGGAMLVMGLIALSLQLESTRGSVQEQLLLHPAVVPLLIGVAAVI